MIITQKQKLCSFLVLFLLLFSTWAEADTTYKLKHVTSVEDGKMYVIMQGDRRLTTVSSNAVQSKTSTKTSGLSGTESYVWRLKAVTGGFRMKMSDNYYLINTSSTNMGRQYTEGGASVWSFTFTDGVAVIRNTSNEGRILGNNGSNAFKAYADDSDIDIYPHNFDVYVLEEEETEYNITITTAKFATFCAEEGLDFSETGVTAYTAKVVGDKVKLTEIEGGQVPGGTGIVLYKDVAENTNVTVPVKAVTATVDDNEMVGTTEMTTVPWQSGDKYNYILQTDGEGKAKFYKATGNILIANRAYLSTAYELTAAHELEIVFEGDEEETTGVVEIAKSQKQTANSQYYNFNGQRVEQPTHGLYIINGRKIAL